MIEDEIRAKIREVEALPESRVRTLRLNSLRAFLARVTQRSIL